VPRQPPIRVTSEDATEEEATSEERERREWGTTASARWHEGCSENRRGTAKRDRKRQTPKGGRRLATHLPSSEIPVWWRRAVLPSFFWGDYFVSFFSGSSDELGPAPLGVGE